MLLRVLACGVCRTDLHIAEGDLPPVRPQLIPGHQIVGEVAAGATAELPLGSRAGVSWIGGIDGDCWYCHHDMENLCDHPTFTGYTVEWRLRRICPGARGLRLSLARRSRQRARRSPAVRRHHRLSQPARGRSCAG